MNGTTDLPTTQVIEYVSSIWGVELMPAGCPKCKQAFLVPAGLSEATCPMCAGDRLAPQPALVRLEPPELLLPFTINTVRLESIYANFLQGIWLAPDDFSLTNLAKRTRRVYWPMWLVDARVSGDWQAEIGFNYQVQSSQENYHNNEWRSQAVVETRVRWKPRLGQIDRRYSNTSSPAIAGHNRLIQCLGNYPVQQALPYDPGKVNGALVRIPDLPPQEAWSYARSALEKRAGADVCQASGGQHIRNFSIRSQFDELHWSQMLLPSFMTYYYDDQGNPQIVWINGATGAIHGPRLASQKKGWRLAAILASIALAVFIVSLVMLLAGAALPPLAAIGTLGVIFAIGIGIIAIVPAVWPWQWNRRQQPEKVVTSGSDESKWRQR